MPLRHICPRGQTRTVSKAIPIRKVVVVSDLHCGSVYGLLPPDFVTLEGNEVRQNLVQRWLWSCWEDATLRWLPAFVGKDPWCLIVNGDAIEGVHHGGREIISPDTADHVNAAEACLSSLGATKAYLTEGTECHVGTREHSIGKAIGAQPRTLDSGRKSYLWPELLLTINGVLCSFSHHITPSSRVYLEASGLSIALGNEQLEATRAGHLVPRIIARAHRHRAGDYSDGHSMIFVTGAWQALTRHGRKVVTRAVPKPSIAGLRFDGPVGTLPKLEQHVYFPASTPSQVL